jgi:hypothetical protein
MKKGTLTVFALSSAALAANAQIIVTDYTLTYTENFNLLAITGTSNSLPPGWSISESGTSARVDGAYTAGTGSSTTGDTYSFGLASSADRALGSLLSSTITSTIGALFVNSGNQTITGMSLQYHGEQWRLGATGRTDRMDFQYSTDATSLGTGTWTDVNALDFTAPVTGGTTGALDGNAAANSATVSSSITGLNAAPSSSFWIRWTDFDATSSDDGLAIDDVSVTYVTVPESGAGLALMGGTVLLAGMIRQRRSGGSRYATFD